MSAARQSRIADGSAGPPADRETPAVTHAAERDNPLQLLRDAIAQLKSSTGELPDQEQIANLLAEAREALEHANVVAHAVAQCDAHVAEDKFEQALAALDEGLHAYSGDAMLVARRRAVEERQRAFHLAAAVRGAIQEAKWLLEHDRTDLAAQFLKQKTAELPDQEELNARLAELQALLPQWEEKRQVRDALARALSLEQLRQWQAALTVVEEALQAHPSNAELREAADRIGGQLAQDERRKKLARRIELIGQQIAAGSWRQALALLESTQREFPGASEIELFRSEIAAGLRRSECEEAAGEVRKFLADGELEQAERALQRGLSALGAEPALDTLRKEVEAEKEYRGQLRQAQLLFGRRKLQEAERILTRLLDRDRPEAQALLEAVRAARAATEEENLLEQGREKALGLIRRQEFAEAADLLRNLLSLFHDNPILERDLAAAQAGLEQQTGVTFATVSTADQQPAELKPLARVKANASLPTAATPKVRPRGRFRWAVFAFIASLAFAAGILWMQSRHPVPAPQPSATPSSAALGGTPAPAVNQQPVLPVAAPPISSPESLPQSTTRQRVSAAGESDRQAKMPSKASNAAPLRTFIPPNAPPSATQNQSGPLPLPPGTNPAISVITIPAAPALLNTKTGVPAPQPPVAVAAPPPEPKPAPPKGVKTEQPEIIRRVLPAYPAQARERNITGEVRLTADIDQHGDVKNVKVVAGNPVLAAAAKNAVMQWKYKPATVNGDPVSTSTEIRLVFVDRGN